jgi:hypothetical protein
MTLSSGPENANSGMSQAIYVEMERLLSPPLQRLVNDAEGEAKVKAQEALDEARNGWKKLSFAIATGVIEHIKSHMVIKEITTQGDINATVSGGTATQENVVFIQNNDGTDHVE